MQQNRYAELDALRGLAALWVVLFHFSMARVQFNWFCNMGVSGVDLFFLISGFVIFMSIKHVSTGTEFVINRVSRLYPTYWACVTFTFVLMVLINALHIHMNHTPVTKLDEYLGNLTMFQYYLGIPSLETTYWTLIIEMLFYILILFLFKLNLLKHINIIGSLINLLIIANYWLVTHNYLPNYNKYFPLVNHFALFFAGIIFFKLITKTQAKLLGYGLILFCLVTQIICYPFAGTDPGFISQHQYIVLLLIYFTAFVLFVNGWLKFIAQKPLVFLGKVSYALYLIHVFFFVGLIGILNKRLHINFWVSALFIALPMAILLATLINNYIEKPVSEKMKVFLKSRFIKQ
jgi:peptidoglycan/LPS O-acetylase OafA/YrhL